MFQMQIGCSTDLNLGGYNSNWHHSTEENVLSLNMYSKSCCQPNSTEETHLPYDLRVDSQLKALYFGNSTNSILLVN